MIEQIGLLEVQAFVKVLLWICAAAGAIMALAGLINMILSPSRKQKERLETLELRVEEAHKFLENDKAAIDALTEKINDLLKIELAHLDHQIDGNGIEKMKEIRKELQEKM